MNNDDIKPLIPRNQEELPQQPEAPTTVEHIKYDGVFAEQLHGPESDFHEKVPPCYVSDPPTATQTTSDLLKTAMSEHTASKQAAALALKAHKDADAVMHKASARVHDLAMKILEEQLGSAYEARVVLYNLKTSRY